MTKGQFRADGTGLSAGGEGGLLMKPALAKRRGKSNPPTPQGRPRSRPTTPPIGGCGLQPKKARSCLSCRIRGSSPARENGRRPPGLGSAAEPVALVDQAVGHSGDVEALTPCDDGAFPDPGGSSKVVSQRPACGQGSRTDFAVAVSGPAPTLYPSTAQTAEVGCAVVSRWSFRSS